MSVTECAGCCEMRPDITRGKCAECWFVEATYLRTNISIVVTIIERVDKRPTPRERETAEVLAGALEPLDRDGYLRGRNVKLDEDGCGEMP